MDADDNRNPINDAALDAEIRGLLAVEPSPSFVARVRTRIASEPERSLSRRSWFGAWGIACAGAAAAVIVVALVLSRPRDNAPGGSTARADIPLAPTGVTQPFPTAVGQPSSPPLARGTVRASARLAEAQKREGVAAARPQAPARPSEPEILVDRREAAALRALIAATRTGRLDLEPVLRASTPTAMDLPAIDDLTIAPLIIDPLLAIDPLEEGARQ